MFKNYIKTALRNISRQKGYVVINIFGLAIGVASSMLIAIYIFSELSYDKHHENKDRIYRVLLDGKINNQEILGAWTPSPMAFTLKEEFPEIEEAVRIDTWDETVVKYEDKSFVESAFIQADSTFFNVFTAPLIKGNPKTALAKPHTVVLSESTAQKIFGEETAIGKTIKIGTYEEYHEVTGIMKDMPKTSHFDCNMVGSFISSARAEQGNWLSNNLATYLLLSPNTSKENVEDKIPELVKENAGPILQEYMGISFDEFIDKGNRYAYQLQPLLDIHLNPSIESDMKTPNDKKYIYIFSVICFFLIVIAAINYMNLSTARASTRAKEVGLRKVVGSSKKMLIKQFMVESLIMSFIAVIIAMILVNLALPYFNNLIKTELTLNYLEDWHFIPALVITALVVGLLAGSYPAFYLSSFKPTTVLSGELKSGTKNKKIRSTLVVSQFIISAALILATIVISKQTNYMLSKDLGFDKDRLLVLRRISAIGDKIETFKNEINKIPGVIKSTHSTMVPGHTNNNNAYQIQSQPKGETYVFETNYADEDFAEVYGIKMAQGRFFSKENSSDKNVCVVNETAIKDYPIKDPFNESIMSAHNSAEELTPLKIVGIVNDFHIKSLHKSISPYIIVPKPEDTQWGYFSIKLDADNIPQAMNEIEKTWKEFSNNDPMLYFFMDNEYASLYEEEQRTSMLSVGFAILTILIASLGLFGLTSYMTEQRTKEIGIRKAMGASVSRVVVIIANETVKLTVIAIIISYPVAYYFLHNWLNNYPYRISLNPVDFIFTLLIIITIAFITISYQTIKTARKNPAYSLRYE